MTYQSGADATVRGNFITNGVLPNSQDTNYRAINNNWPVFGFANALGNVGTAPVTTLYTMVHAQQNAIYFDGANGLTSVPSLWIAYFNSDLSMVRSLLWFHRRIPRLIFARSSSFMVILSTRLAQLTMFLRLTLWLLGDKITSL